MHRFFSYRVAHSEKNGEIVIQRWFGRTYVMVNGYFESGPYLEAMWRKAIRRVPSTAIVQSVLMLGLGGGSAINPIHSQFPSVRITVLEWDPVMIDLSHQLHLYDESIKPELINGDAVELLPLLMRKFDLVLVDLFKGQTAEPRLSTPAMIDSISQVLNPSGHVILNAFKDDSLIEDFGRRLEHRSTWRFKHNRLALFANFL